MICDLNSQRANCNSFLRRVVAADVCQTLLVGGLLYHFRALKDEDSNKIFVVKVTDAMTSHACGVYGRSTGPNRVRCLRDNMQLTVHMTRDVDIPTHTQARHVTECVCLADSSLSVSQVTGTSPLATT